MKKSLVLVVWLGAFAFSSLLFTFFHYNPPVLLIDAGTIHVTSATILGLTSFGALVGVRLNNKTKFIEKQVKTIRYTLLSVLLIIATQGITLILNCCVGLEPLLYVIMLILSLCGFSFLVWGVYGVIKGNIDSEVD